MSHHEQKKKKKERNAPDLGYSSIENTHEARLDVIVDVTLLFFPAHELGTELRTQELGGRWSKQYRCYEPNDSYTALLGIIN